MKKYVIAAIGLVAIIATMGLVSAGYGSGDCEQQHISDSYVDADNDGVCDNFIDENGDGMNDARLMDGSGNQYKYGAGLMQGSGYGPGDGICINQ